MSKTRLIHKGQQDKGPSAGHPEASEGVSYAMRGSEQKPEWEHLMRSTKSSTVLGRMILGVETPAATHHARQRSTSPGRQIDGPRLQSIARKRRKNFQRVRRPKQVRFHRPAPVI